MRDYPTANYSFDEQLLEQLKADGQSRVKVYPFTEVAVVLGKGSKAEVELELTDCQQDKVKILRRRGGGCAVVLDPGNVIVSLALFCPGFTLSKTYWPKLSKWLIDGLEKTGVSGVKQAGISDLAIGNKKIGGACIYRTKDLLFYSVSLLLDPDMSLIERYLKHPPREPDYRQGRSHTDFLSCLMDCSAWQEARQFASALKQALEIPEL